MPKVFPDLQYEKDIWRSGLTHVAGLDEAGRGALAGPLVAGACVIDDGFVLDGLTDSKLLSAVKREEFFDVLMKCTVAAGVGMVAPHEIDMLGVTAATGLAFRRALSDLGVGVDFVLADAFGLQDARVPSKGLVKGDQKSVSIAAASVLAKVARDRMMQALGSEFPEYGFENHVGYGTKAHYAALEKYGLTLHHRRLFLRRFKSS